MNIDQILGKVLDSCLDNNAWDVEAYAIMGLEYLNAGNTLSNEIEANELRNFLNMVLEEAQKITKAEKFKRDLIEEIVNFRG